MRDLLPNRAVAADKDATFRWAIYTISAQPKDSELPGGTEGSDKDGYAVAAGFDRSAVKAAAMLKAASKHVKFIALQRYRRRKPKRRARSRRSWRPRSSGKTFSQGGLRPAFLVLQRGTFRCSIAMAFARGRLPGTGAGP